MSCASPNCAMCDHPTPASPALAALESSLLATSLSLLRTLAPPPKSSATKSHKAALKALPTLQSASNKRQHLPWTATTAAVFLRTFDGQVLPLLELKQERIVADSERWEEMMPSLVEDRTSPGEMGLEEVFEEKKKRWRGEIAKLGEVGAKWDELSGFLREVTGRGVKQEEAAAEGEAGSVAGSGHLSLPHGSAAMASGH
ncbi:hypothetical protein JCM10213_004823 [Rhodosporidiobolus nylandii]